MRGVPVWMRLALAWSAVASVSAAAPGPGVEPAAAPTPLLTLSEPAKPETAAAEDWTRRLSIGGGLAVYYYQPTNGWDNQYLLYTNLRFDAQLGRIGLHLESRLTNEKLRAFFDSLAWIQEGYLSVEAGPLVLKAGKVYKQLGLFWDKTFYGNIQVYEGLKLDPNAGLSLEGTFGAAAGLAFWAQYFVVDGHTNASLVGRDTISIPDARRRNIVTLRAQPFFQLTPSARLELGISGEHFEADLPSGSESVWRGALDTKLTWAGLGLWGELLHQSGKHVTSFPYPGDTATTGQASADNTYLLAGAEYTISLLTLRYNLSIARYSELWVQEVLHLPGVEVAFNANSSFYVEYASWKRYAPEGTSVYDASLNLTWLGHF
ncbi:MAG TPA: hypothetical protein VIW29_00295 [Polyangiaceae bacterium]